MPWFKRGEAVQEGPGSTVDLRTLANLTGQLLFAHGLRANQLSQIPCKVLRVDRSEILVEPTGGAQRPGVESAVILEVLHHQALIQCFTIVRRAERSGQLALHLPERPHIVQRRRNPRVDLYVAVTFHTPDRPIEESPAQMINLSLDGAACVLTEPLAPGSQMRLNLSSLGIIPSQINALVVRCVPTPTHLWVIGLRFQELRPEQEGFLSEYIDRVTQTMLQVSGDGDGQNHPDG